MSRYLNFSSLHRSSGGNPLVSNSTHLVTSSIVRGLIDKFGGKSDMSNDWETKCFVHEICSCVRLVSKTVSKSATPRLRQPPNWVHVPQMGLNVRKARTACVVPIRVNGSGDCASVLVVYFVVIIFVYQ